MREGKLGVILPLTLFLSGPFNPFALVWVVQNSWIRILVAVQFWTMIQMGYIFSLNWQVYIWFIVLFSILLTASNMQHGIKTK